MSTEKEQKVLDELKRFFTRAGIEAMSAGYREYTFSITSHGISSRHSISATGREEAEKHIREKFGTADVTWVSMGAVQTCYRFEVMTPGGSVTEILFARDVYEAERILKAQYPGSRINRKERGEGDN